jgi:hypothetical protein
MDPPEGGKTVAPLVGRERLLERYVFGKKGTLEPLKIASREEKGQVVPMVVVPATPKEVIGSYCL